MIHNFNLSPSSLNLYLDSEITFYFTYLLKPEPDTKEYTAYSLGGNAVHNSLEKYAHERNIKKTIEYFNKFWETNKISDLPALFNKKLQKEKYLTALKKGIKLINEKYDVISVEKRLQKKLIEYKGFKVDKKGFVDLIGILKKDLVINKKGSKVIVDWKTSNSVDQKGVFRKQALFYAHMIYCLTGEIINGAIFEYLKINTYQEYYFEKEEIIKFGDYLKKIVIEIINKSSSIKNFSIGNYDSPFNKYKGYCEKEITERNNNTITIIIKNNRFFIKNIPKDLEQYINEYFSYKVDGYFFTEAYKKRLWDGKKRFYQKNTLPLGFLNKFKEIINKYNDVKKKNFFIQEIDYRDEKIMKQTYNTVFQKNNVVLRPYQEEAIKKIIDKKIGIIQGTMSFGKTIMSAELIKKLNKKTLFVINRIELVRQTADVYEKFLGIKVGVMVEGNLSIDKQVTVASIKTIYAILNRNNEDTEKIINYLNTLNIVIYDECNGVSDSKMYSALGKQLINVEYVVGLSATPFRRDNSTLEMNSLVGFPIYKKDSETLEKQKIILPVKIIFHKINNVIKEVNNNSFFDAYRSLIVNNEVRNEKIVSLAKKYFFKNKKVIIVVNSIKHGEIINDKLKNSFFINGQTNNKLRKEKFDLFKKTNDFILISMVKIIGIGIDVPDLDVIINASGNQSPSDVIQIAGRTQRKHLDKKEGVYIDFLDVNNYFNKFSKKRMNVLKTYFNKEIEVVD